MLKKRLTACVIIKDGRVVQSIGFKKYLPVGNLDITVEFLNQWGIDEIVILDMDATAQGRRPDCERIARISKRNFAPLAVGGGIRTIEDMRQLVHSGADKIVINAIALERPSIITEAADVFGAQCIVVSIDVRKNSDGTYEVFRDSAKTPTGKDPVVWACDVQALGAGEIFLNAVDRDGSKEGYDIQLIQKVAQAVHIPVIACGGVGSAQHVLEGAKETAAWALAVGNFLNFTEQSPTLIKAYLHQHGVDVRVDTYANFKDHQLDEEFGRLTKKSDDILDKLRFVYHPEEVI
jgi:cyclase